MHRVFQNYVDRLLSAQDLATLGDAMGDTAAALDLSCFAYLSVPRRHNIPPQLISNYPSAWTAHYLQRRYERLDPVVSQALDDPEPFEWGPGVGPIAPSTSQRELFDEAAEFGIRYGFTIPIHDKRGPIAAVTFAANERRPQFERSISEHAEVLQLMAMYFHAHVRRKFGGARTVDGISLSSREFECLEWAAQGKSAWEIGASIWHHEPGPNQEHT